MKGYALVGRNKMKDAYDIYFSIQNYEGGPIALAKECSLLLQDAVARQGYQYIADKFRSVDDFGPVTVSRFLEESNLAGDVWADRIQTDAFMRVSAFLKELKF